MDYFFIYNILNSLFDTKSVNVVYSITITESKVASLWAAPPYKTLTQYLLFILLMKLN